MSKSLRSKHPPLSAPPRRLAALRRQGLIALSSACLLLGWPHPARADLETLSKTLPQQAIAAVALDLRPASWEFYLKQPGLKELLLSGEFREMAADFKGEFGIEPGEMLTALGSHAMLAMYPNPTDPEEPSYLFSLETTRSEPVMKILAHIRNEAGQVRAEAYKGTELLIKETASGEAPEVAIAYHGNNLLFASRPELLKQSLDLAATDQGLLANSGFRPVYQALGQEPVLVWVDVDALKSEYHDKNDREAFAGEFGAFLMFQRWLTLTGNLGFGLRFDARGLSIRNQFGFSLAGPQQAVLARAVGELEPLDPLLGLMPARPLASLASSTFRLNFDDPTAAGSEENQKIRQEQNEILSEIRKATGLDLAQDLYAYSDGRIGFSAFYLGNYPKYDKAPELVAMLGVKDGEAFLANLQQKLALKPDSPAADDTAAPAVTTLDREPVESYRGVSLYGLKGGPQANAVFGEMQAEPTVALINRVFLVGSSRAALRAVIDQAQGIRSTLTQDPEFVRIRSRMHGHGEAELFYSDLSRWFRLGDHFLHADSGFRTAKPLLASLRALAGDSTLTATGSEGHFLADADLAQVDFLQLAHELKQAGQQQQLADVERNMQQLRAMVINYRDRNDGRLPKNAAQLLQHAQEHDYNLLSPNPYTQELGLATKPGLGALMDFHDWLAYKSTAALAGLVLLDAGDGKRVRIYGTDAQGRLLQEQGKPILIEVGLVD
ncbi:MAG TPA: DUF3352 domain-containing protein [Candidatus Obscuribacterales bacterium]